MSPPVNYSRIIKLLRFKQARINKNYNSKPFEIEFNLTFSPMVSTKRSYILKQKCTSKLLVCLSIYVLVTTRYKRVKPSNKRPTQCSVAMTLGLFPFVRATNLAELLSSRYFNISDVD